MCIRDRYAVWEKDPNYSETREITSTSGINGSVTFLEWVDDINYSLQIKELDVPESLAKEDVYKRQEQICTIQVKNIIYGTDFKNFQTFISK